MMIYMNAMKQCYLTLRQKFAARYGINDLNLNDFSYFAFHTPFSKMVQKTFLALILADIQVNYAQLKTNAAPARYAASLMEQLAAKSFENDSENLNLVLKHFGERWRD